MFRVQNPTNNYVWAEISFVVTFKTKDEPHHEGYASIRIYDLSISENPTKDYNIFHEWINYRINEGQAGHVYPTTPIRKIAMLPKGERLFKVEIYNRTPNIISPGFTCKFKY